MAARRLTLKTYELVLDIILIVVSGVVARYRPQWPFFTGDRRRTTVAEIVLDLALVAGGGFMIWRSQR